MKISFMTFAAPNWTLKQVIDAAVRHGYQGIEFRTDATHKHGVEVAATSRERRDIRQEMEDHGLAIPCLATSLQFATDRVADEAPARVELAHDLGAKALRVFCGPRPEGISHAELIERVGKQLRAVAQDAASAGVELWLETHDTFCKATDAVAAVRVADHPSVAINYDNMHPYRAGEPLEKTIAEISGLVRHTHFHDGSATPDKVVVNPVGKGSLPMDAMFAALVNMGYTGYLSGEWFGEMYGPDPDTSLERFRNDMVTLANRHGVTLG